MTAASRTEWRHGRVVHIISGLTVGGAETSLLRLVSTVRRQHHAVVVLGGPGPLSDRISRTGTRIEHLGYARGRMPISAPMDLVRIIRPLRPDCLHGWMYHGCCAAMVARELAAPRARLVWGVRQTLASLEHEPTLTKSVILASTVLARRAHHIVYNSAASRLQHEHFGYPRKKGVLIPNGYDIDEFRPDGPLRERFRRRHSLAASDVVVGLAARFHPMKDHANFFSAAVLAAAEDASLRWMVAGDGATADRADLASLIPPAIADRVRLIGRCDDMPAFHAAVDMITSSSAWGEAFPNAVAEGMASGAIPVATDVGDTALIVGNSGFVVPPRSPRALADAWLRVSRSTAAERAAASARARERIRDRFSLGAVAASYESLYASELPCAA